MSVKRNDRQSGKQKQEEACAQCFLEWYNKQYRTKFSLQRAEEGFSRLAGGTRWEFVAKQCDGDAEWVAIEVKGLVIPEARRQFMDWKKFFERATKDLECRLKGNFLVIGAPALKLNQEEQFQLRRAVVQAMLDVAPTMKRNENLDLGPKILDQFPNWPFSLHSEMKPQPHIVKNAYELWLFRTSDSGCSVELGMPSPYVFNVQGAEKEAIRLLLNPTSKGDAKANEQLRVAKEMGAKETILLLDCHLPYRLEAIRQALADADSNLLSNIDSVYLVSVSDKQVTEVYKKRREVR